MHPDFIGWNCCTQLLVNAHYRYPCDRNFWCACPKKLPVHVVRQAEIWYSFSNGPNALKIIPWQLPAALPLAENWSNFASTMDSSKTFKHYMKAQPFIGAVLTDHIMGRIPQASTNGGHSIVPIFPALASDLLNRKKLKTKIKTTRSTRKFLRKTETKITNNTNPVTAQACVCITGSDCT